MFFPTPQCVNRKLKAHRVVLRLACKTKKKAYYLHLE